MPSSFTHAIAGIGFASAAQPRPVPLRYWVLAAVAATIVDVDYLWSYRGLPSEHWLAHRGLTHSPGFAATTSAAGVGFLIPFSAQRFFLPWRPLTGAHPAWATTLPLEVFAVFGRELLWIWVPSLALFRLGVWRRRYQVPNAGPILATVPERTP